jgi:hypothetical protein
MPIPNPHQNEDKDKFVSRCMSSEVMKKEYPDSKQRVAICLSQTKKDKHAKNQLLEDVQDNLAYLRAEYDNEWDEFTQEIVPEIIYEDNDEQIIAKENNKNNKKVTLNKPFRTPSGPKKFSVYVKNEKGNVVKVNFGDPNMEIKRDDPERRKSYRARHNCDNPGPKWKAEYWSCKMWSKTNVSDLT